MPNYPNQQNNDAAAIPVRTGLQTNPAPSTAVPATIAGSGSWNSGVIPSQSYSAIVAAATLSQAGSITINRFIDAAGVIPIGTVASQVLSAATPGWVGINDGLIFASFNIVIANTSGSSGDLSGVAILLGKP
jgi:hypothetical protein